MKPPGASAGRCRRMLALAFGILIVIVVMEGSLWIMAKLNHDMRID